MNKISNQKGLRRRSFDLIRKPELIGLSFLFNNVKVRYVGTNPENNISFYVNFGQGGVVGVRVYPDGRKVPANATPIKCGKSYAHGNAEYLQFKNAFGTGKHILASHAVYIAWRNKEIPAGMTIDHIDGCTTNNFIGNLRRISLAINSRDGGFLTKLRKQGINPGTSSRQTGWRSQLTFGFERQEQRGASLQPDMASAEKGTCIPRWMLLRYFDRMAIVKANVSEHRYSRLTRADLEILLYYTDQAAAFVLNKKYNLQLNFQPSTGMGSPTQLAKVVMGRAVEKPIDFWLRKGKAGGEPEPTEKKVALTN
ncbi:MAG: hypothetical protein IJR42_07410 [Paludibacteraceae bacterium]|nr:hypothetical protein [Paludibacteraceae bacterium]